MLSPPVLLFATELCLFHLVCSVEFTATWFANESHFARRTTHNVGPNLKSTWLRTVESRDSLEIDSPPLWERVSFLLYLIVLPVLILLTVLTVFLYCVYWLSCAYWLVIDSPPSWGRTDSSVRTQRIWQSSLVRTYWRYSLYCVYLTVLPYEDVLTPDLSARIDSPPSWAHQIFPRWRPWRVFPFLGIVEKRNSENWAGGHDPWKGFDFTFPRDHIWSIPKTHRNLGQGWLFELEVRCRPSICIHRGKCTTFQPPPPPANHPWHKWWPLLVWIDVEFIDDSQMNFSFLPVHDHII